MQVHRGLEDGIVLAFAPNGGNDHWFGVASAGKTFSDRMCKGGMGAELQQNINAEICDGVDCRRKLHRLPNAASPVSCVSSISRNPISRDSAEKRNAFRLCNHIR